MKSFGINGLGLEERNSNEIVCTNGGSLLGILGLVVIIAVAAITALVLAFEGRETTTDLDGLHMSF